jgi:hypothetical protein
MKHARFALAALLAFPALLRAENDFSPTSLDISGAISDQKKLAQPTAGAPGASGVPAPNAPFQAELDCFRSASGAGRHAYLLPGPEQKYLVLDRDTVSDAAKSPAKLEGVFYGYTDAAAYQFHYSAGPAPEVTFLFRFPGAGAPVRASFRKREGGIDIVYRDAQPADPSGGQPLDAQAVDSAAALKALRGDLAQGIAGYPYAMGDGLATCAKIDDPAIRAAVAANAKKDPGPDR